MVGFFPSYSTENIFLFLTSISHPRNQSILTLSKCVETTPGPAWGWVVAGWIRTEAHQLAGAFPLPSGRLLLTAPVQRAKLRGPGRLSPEDRVLSSTPICSLVPLHLKSPSNFSVLGAHPTPSCRISYSLGSWSRRRL